MKYCESLSTKQKDLSHMPAVKFSLNQETVELEQFMQCMKFDVVKKAGFFISKAYPHLGATPDCIVAATELNNESLVEIKCSYTNRFSGEPPNYLDWVFENKGLLTRVDLMIRCEFKLVYPVLI